MTQELKKQCMLIYQNAGECYSKNDMVKLLKFNDDDSLEARAIFGDLGGRYETRHSLGLKVVISYLCEKLEQR